ncbi:putative gpi anchored [Diaporthe ampelina]|uniref:Putative gpi anchored n=1 Tax=Diaporthe ampelina TaxID=1214573 RepID=A0A0G2FV79_9PEZI|nr:putative gpi anchored [Diaporthe ampelina]
MASSPPVYSEQTIRNATCTKTQPVVLDPVNIRPRGGFEAALSNGPSSSDDETKIIYAVRHGNTPHNEDFETWGKPAAWRYLSGLAKNFDPQITPEGVLSTARAGRFLRDMVRTESAPRPVMIYSSPLRRCVETSIHMIKQAGLDRPRPDGHRPPVMLRVKEGLREWMGYGHGHQSDRKGSRAEIQALVEQLQTNLGVGVPYELDVPEQEHFHDEVYLDVDRRVRGVLDDMYSDADSGTCVMLMLHSRSNKSLLRVLGHPPADVDSFEVANCAVLPYRVTRRGLARGEVAARAAYEDAQWHEDHRNAEASKNAMSRQAIEDVRAWGSDPRSRHRLDSLRDLLRFHMGQGDPATGSALNMLEEDLKPPQY